MRYIITVYEHRTHLTSCLVKHKDLNPENIELHLYFDTRITLLKYSDNSLRGTNKVIRRQPICYMIIQYSTTKCCHFLYRNQILTQVKTYTKQLCSVTSLLKMMKKEGIKIDSR